MRQLGNSRHPGFTVAIPEEPPVHARIIERLRASYATRQLPTWGDLDDAATELERLERHSAQLEKTLLRVMEQVEKDLAAAHAEIVKLQGGDPAKHAWPVWSAPAHTLAWFKEVRADIAKAKGEHASDAVAEPEGRSP